MSIKHLMNPQSLKFELDSTLDGGDFYPIIEPSIIAEQTKIMFGELHFGFYIEAIMIVIEQNKLGNSYRPSISTTTYANIQKAKQIVERSILNN